MSVKTFDLDGYVRQVETGVSVNVGSSDYPVMLRDSSRAARPFVSRPVWNPSIGGRWRLSVLDA